MNVRPVKTQISLSIRPVRSEFSLCAQLVAKDPSFLHADSEDSDQTGRMPRLIWVFAGRTPTLLVLSCRGSYRSVWRSSTFHTRNEHAIFCDNHAHAFFFFFFFHILTADNLHLFWCLIGHYRHRLIRNLFNPHLTSGPVHPYQLDKSISNFRVVWCTFSFLFYFK